MKEQEKWSGAAAAMERVWPRVRPDLQTPPPEPPAPHPPRPGQAEGPRPHWAGPPPAQPVPPKPKPDMDSGPPASRPPETEPPELRELAELIRQEAALGLRYLALADRTEGKTGAALRRLSTASGRLLKHLQQEYFMRTGDSCPVPRRRQGTRRSLPQELRELLGLAGELEQRYLHASASGGDPALRELYAEAAERKRTQARLLRELIQTFFR